MHRFFRLSLSLLLGLTACGPSSPPEQATPLLSSAGDAGDITLSSADDADTVSAQALSDLQVLLVVGRVGRSGTTSIFLSAPGSTAYTVTAPAWLPVTPGSGLLKNGNATLKGSFTCPAQPQNFLGSLTVTTTNVSQSATVPAILICNTASSPAPYVYPPVTGAVPGSTVTSPYVRLSGLSGSSPLTTLGGSALVNGAPFTGTTVRNGDQVALRVQASAFGKTTVAVVGRAEPSTGIFLVSTRSVTVPATLSSTPNRLDFLDVQPSSALPLSITRTAALAAPTLSSTCTGIATATPGAVSAAASAFTVVPLAAGTCSLTFASGTAVLSVPVTVTTTSVTAH